MSTFLGKFVIFGIIPHVVKSLVMVTAQTRHDYTVFKTYSRSPLSRMGTHRSTTTNQQVGLRITEMFWEASKVTQNGVVGEQRETGHHWKSCMLKSPSLSLSLWVHATVPPLQTKRGKKTFSNELDTEKKWRLLISAVKKICRVPYVKREFTITLSPAIFSK